MNSKELEKKVIEAEELLSKFRKEKSSEEERIHKEYRQKCLAPNSVIEDIKKNFVPKALEFAENNHIGLFSRWGHWMQPTEIYVVDFGINLVWDVDDNYFYHVYTWEELL